MRKFFTISILILFVALFTSCKKDKLITNSSAKLSFTVDSVLFDTVFTSIGSTTKLFRVHNNNNGIVNISSIKLARGTSSFYVLNVDGTSGKSFTDIEIAAHDSIYIFVKVTIDPNADPSVSPFIYRDSILFETNGNAQHLDLISFGQNAYYHMPNQKIIINNTSAIFYDTLHVPFHGTDTWLTDKPHLIYGYVVVDSTQTLVIPAGAKIYIHNNGGIWVYKYGTIQVNGTHGNEVIFRGDRLEAEYKDLPGQWDRIWINEGSNNNIINYAIIKNGFIGIQAGYSVLDGYGGNTISPTPPVPKHLYLSNTIIQNCSFAGLLADFYNITGGNDVISNCGSYLCALRYGGNYSFTQCTFANYWSQTNNSSSSQTRTTPSYFFNNYVDASTILPFDSLFFGNCILAGNLADEFQFDTLAGGFNYSRFQFDHCLLTTQQNTSNLNIFKSCLINSPSSSNPPSFLNPGIYDFHLNNNSAALNTGNTTYVSRWPVTIDNTARNSPPNMGAY